MSKKWRKKLKNEYIHAFITSLIAGGLFLAFLIACHIVPFGESTWLIYDMKRQYVDFYSYFKTILSGENDILYSSAIALGSGAVGFFTYYLSSPVLILLSFFDISDIPAAITLMIGLKLMMASALCDIFLIRYIRREDKSIQADKIPVTMVFALSYTFCAYMISNSVNPMWLDVFALMPLAVLMLDRLIFEGAKVGYLVVLALMLWCNYYITFMVCIFIVFWTVYRLISDKKEIFARLFRVAICSFWAFCLDAILIVPTALSLLGSPKDIFVLGLETTGKELGLKDILVKIWFLAYERNQTIFGTPLIYAGVLTVFLVLLYFLNTKINRKEKIGMLFFMLIFGISFAVDKINLIWHAGMEPSGYPYREAFLYVFVCLLCGCRCYNKLEGIDIKRVILAGAIVVSAFVYSLLGEEIFEDARFIMTNGALILLDFVLILGYVIFTTKGRFHRTDITEKLGKMLLWILVIIQIAELMVNSKFIYGHQTAMNMLTQSEYVRYLDDTSKAVAIAKEDKSFYHMDTMKPREQNDDMMFNYNGLTHYSSAGLLYTRYFLQKLGYNDDGLYTAYGHDNTCSADSLLGIKYIIGAEGYRDGYNELSGSEPGLWENPYALSVAVVADYISDSIEDNPFKMQENMYDDINGRENQLFINDIIWSQQFAENGVGYYCYMCKAACDGYVYMYIDDIEEYTQNLVIYVEDEAIAGYGNNSSLKIVNLGYHKKGELFDVYVKPDSKNAHFGKAYIVTEDMEALKKSYQASAERNCEINRLSSSEYEIFVGDKLKEATGGGILTTIPYEDCWRVSTDEKRIDIQNAYGAFIYIPYSEIGDSDVITLKYVPEGMIEGGIISMIAVLGIVLLIIIDRRRQGDKA